MCEKKLNMPVITIDTDGMELYDVGEEKAWLELFRTFAEKEMIDKASERIKPNLDIEKKQGKIGVLGLTPQDISDLRHQRRFENITRKKKEKKQSATAWEKMSAGARMVLIIIEQQERLKKYCSFPGGSGSCEISGKNIWHTL